jgi:hypothetical protein
MGIVSIYSHIWLIEIFSSRDDVLVLDEYHNNGYGLFCSNRRFVFWGFIPISVFVEIMFKN